MEHIRLSDENYERLLQYQNIFDNVKKTNTLKGAIRKNTLDIADIINRKANYSCSACVFRLYKQAGEILEYNIELRKKKKGRPKKEDKIEP